MTHYSENSGMVRVDYFKPSGKWYMTEAHDMSDYYNDLDIHKAIEAMLERDGRNLKHFTRVILEPYHRNAYPIMLIAET